MSFILDALKKSEQERKMGDFPDLNSEHQLLIRAPDRESSLLNKVFGAFGLLVIVVVVVALFMFRSDPENNFSTSPQNEVRVVENLPTKSLTIITPQAQIETDSGEVLEGEIIRPDPERRALLQKNIAQEASVDARVKQQYENWFSQEESLIQAEKDKLANLQKQNLEAQQAVTSEAVTQTSVTPTASDPVVTAPTSEAVAEEIAEEITVEEEKDYELDWNALPTIADLDQSDKKALPKLAVSTHIYSNAISFRKVTVNGLSMRVGDSLDETLRLLAITDEGVVFQFRDKIFKMNALEEWKGM